jgi:membrane protein implicated in regulation of membrane protease activity
MDGKRASRDIFLLRVVLGSAAASVCHNFTKTSHHLHNFIRTHIMSDWMGWLLGAGVLIIVELFSATFYLLMIALGLAAGGIAAVLGAGVPLQTVAAAVAGVAATLLLKRFRNRRGQQLPRSAARDPNVHLDIGQTINVPQWQNGMARVMYRGALWDVELAPGGDPGAGSYAIREVRGSRLILA